VTSGVTKGLRQRGKLAERGPTAKAQKKLEMMVKPDVDGYAITLNNQKILRKTQ